MRAFWKDFLLFAFFVGMTEHERKMLRANPAMLRRLLRGLS